MIQHHTHKLQHQNGTSEHLMQSHINWPLVGAVCLCTEQQSYLFENRVYSEISLACFFSFFCFFFLLKLWGFCFFFKKRYFWLIFKMLMSKHSEECETQLSKGCLQSSNTYFSGTKSSIDLEVGMLPLYANL